MGDFNTDLLVPLSTRSRKLLDLVESVSLHILPLQATHHNIEGEDTWLDLILTSNPDLVHSHGQVPAPGFSHHDLIYLSYVLKPPKSKPKVLRVRCFGRMDGRRLCEDAAKISWDELTTATSIDDKVTIFNAQLQALYDTHAPVRKFKLKRPPAPWMTSEVRMAMKRRDRALAKFRRRRTEENWTSFKVARNRCNQMVRNAKRRHILENITSASSANIWKFLKTLGIGSEKNKDFQGTIALDDLNRHFSASAGIDHHVKSLTIEFIAGLPKPDIDPFQFSPMTSDDISKIILSIRSNAIGYDKITRRMITTALDHLILTITHIINFSFSTNMFPSQWRKAYVIPLPKILNPNLVTHFRPISILPFLSKVLEACAQTTVQLYSFTTFVEYIAVRFQTLPQHYYRTP
uniref:RNA-directed DNA polymerase from transposon X-element n=1 Tax=Bombyx mori TaxID=7091 RepID=A0A8R2R618_BOMMO|nr:uncharacterized protein LOC119629726 [Bombyx mori]